MTSPTTEPPDLIDSAGDLWIYVTDMGDEGVDPMYYMLGQADVYFDPDEIERLRTAEQDNLSMWAYERYEWVRDAHGPITERPRGPVAEPAPDLIDGVGDHWVCVGDRDGDPRYVCIGRGERVHDDGYREAQRANVVGRYGEWPSVGMTRAQIVEEWHSVTERPRGSQRIVAADEFEAAMQEAADPPDPEPEPAPEGRVTGAGGFALDDDGLPVDPGPDHPEEERLAAIQARTEAVLARHEQFRRDTRTEVLASQDRHGWCAPGTDRVLCDLGLDKINAVRRVTATVSFEISGTNSDQNASTFARNKIDRAIREALGDRLRGDLSVDPGRVVVTRHED